MPTVLQAADFYAGLWIPSTWFCLNIYNVAKKTVNYYKLKCVSYFSIFIILHGVGNTFISETPYIS